MPPARPLPRKAGAVGLGACPCNRYRACGIPYTPVLEAREKTGGRPGETGGRPGGALKGEGVSSPRATGCPEGHDGWLGRSQVRPAEGWEHSRRRGSSPFEYLRILHAGVGCAAHQRRETPTHRRGRGVRILAPLRPRCLPGRSEMNLFFLLLGAFLLAFVIIDLLWTTLWVDGGSGPISGRLSTVLWAGLRRLGGRRSRTLSLAGPIILTATLFVWVALIWGGWALLFAGDAGSLVNARADEPVTWAGRIYFVAFSMFTMGNGDLYPAGGFWQIVTSLTTASGMLFVTMGVSYILSILGAVATKRSFASSVTGLGGRGEEVIAAGWDGKTLHALDLPLSALGSRLSLLVEQHKAYPVLHYYHSQESEDASAVAVAILDETLTLIHAGVPDDAQPDPILIKSARSSVESYLETLNSAFITPAAEAPPRPDLSRLRAAGIPTIPEDAFTARLAALDARRRKLLGMIRADAWEWPPVEVDAQDGSREQS